MRRKKWSHHPYSKMGNIKTFVNGLKFDSQKEAKRYQELRLLELAGKIELLHCQPKFPMVINERKICTYIADFRYQLNGELVIEDVKSAFTAKLPVFRLKQKLFEALYPTLKLTIVD